MQNLIHVVLLAKPMCEQKLVMKLIVSFNNILIYCNILYFINFYLSNRSEFIFCCHEHAWYTVYFPHSHHHHYYYIPLILFSFYEELSTLGAVIFEVFWVVFHPNTLTWRTGVFCERFLCSLTHRLWLFLVSWHKPFATLLLNIMHFQDLWLNNVIQVVHTLNFVSVGVCSSCAHMFSPLRSTFFATCLLATQNFVVAKQKEGYQ